MEHLEVTISEGKLRGKTAKDYENNTYFSFQGIPYAKPPIGNLRFKAPVEPQKWTEVLDATKESDPCYSRHIFDVDKIIGSENCLNLNVYTKNLPIIESTKLAPVMFWIHGGGLIYGTSSLSEYGPDYLITQNVVLITFDYRLGIFASLVLEDPSLEITGNLCFKDMIMALKWVQKNIIKFGGDPNNVTIFGESAGGLSCHSLFLSPLAKGLFHKVIVQSGSALAPWSTKHHSDSEQLCRILKKPEIDDTTLLEILLKKSPEELIEIQFEMSDNIIACEERSFALFIDKNAKEPFMPDEPINLILAGNFNQVPLLTGYTTSEGMCFEHFNNPKNTKTGIESDIDVHLGYKIGSEESKEVAEKVHKFYANLPNLTESEKKTMIKSDSMFIYSAYITAIQTAIKSSAPVYLYQFSIDTSLNFFKKIIKNCDRGAAHCDDLGYLWKCIFTPEIKPNSLEDISIKRMVKLWTNFAKFSNPTPMNGINNELLCNVIWKPVEINSINCLDIGEELVAIKDPLTDRVTFWNEIYKNSPVKTKICLH